MHLNVLLLIIFTYRTVQVLSSFESRYIIRRVHVLIYIYYMYQKYRIVPNVILSKTGSSYSVTFTYS